MDYNLIKEKEDKINHAMQILKSEFVGIDEQIDAVINNMKSWYLFPELQTSPIIVNLWGMTGCGKTSLIKRIVNLLDLEKDLVYFNFAEIGELSSWEVESNLEDMLGNENTNRIFVYDEFQYAATKSQAGLEKDNKHGLKPFWELLDTGIINRKTSYWKNKTIFEIILSLDTISMFVKPILENGIWVNKKECISSLNKAQIESVKSKLNIEKETVHSFKSEDIVSNSPNIDEEEYNEHILQPYTLNKICDMSNFQTLSLEEQIRLPEKLLKMSFDELYNYISDMFDNMRKGHELNYKNSIIFVLGNLDEAYDISFNVDPDMSPDQFHEITKKINVVDIKKALQQRFRNEQIARLGNIHLIYPSFDSKSFKKIIEINLDKYANEVKLLTNYNLIFDETVKEIIYKESVFPTHGTRPIFSTIHELVKGILPNIVLYIYDNKLLDVDTLVYEYQSENIIVKFLSNDKEIGRLINKPTLRIDNLRKVEENEKQYIVSVHEAGHFIVYCALNGKVPEKLRSKTANSANGGFMLSSVDDEENVDTIRNLKNKIAISLGGYVAEKIVFGEDDISNGASSDLKNVTLLASRMIRNWGMGKLTATSTYLEAPDCNQNGGDVKLTKEKEYYINEQIISLLDDAKAKAEYIVKSYKELYIKIVDYLIKNDEIDKKTMNEMYSDFIQKNPLLLKYLNKSECISRYDMFKKTFL